MRRLALPRASATLRAGRTKPRCARVAGAAAPVSAAVASPVGRISGEARPAIGPVRRLERLRVVDRLTGDLAAAELVNAHAEVPWAAVVPHRDLHGEDVVSAADPADLEVDIGWVVRRHSRKLGTPSKRSPTAGTPGPHRRGRSRAPRLRHRRRCSRNGAAARPERLPDPRPATSRRWPPRLRTAKAQTRPQLRWGSLARSSDHHPCGLGRAWWSR